MGSSVRKVQVLMVALLLAAGLQGACAQVAANDIDVFTATQDRHRVATTEGPPAADQRVFMTLPGCETTKHTLYLPKNWKATGNYPVLVEYLGNNGNVSTNKTHASMGQLICNRRDYIVLCLPFLNEKKVEQQFWWGDPATTVAYAKAAIRDVCANWGGDADKLVLIGHSRGAIACNYIGLYDDEIAKLWRGMIPVSHYGNRHMGLKGHLVAWEIPEGVDIANMQRLGSTPQLIVAEYHDTAASPKKIKQKSAQSIGMLKAEHGITTMDEAVKQMKLAPAYIPEQTVEFIDKYGSPDRRIDYLPLPYLNHTPDYFQFDIPQRAAVEAWLSRILGDAPAARIQPKRKIPGHPQT